MITETLPKVSDSEIKVLMVMARSISRLMASRRKDCDEDELMSVSLVALWEAISRWRPELGSLSKRVGYIVRLRIKDHIRTTSPTRGPRGGRGRSGKGDFVVEQSINSDPESSIDIVDLRNMPNRYLAACDASLLMTKLSHNERELINDHFYSGYSVTELAKSHCQSKVTINRRLNLLVSRALVSNKLVGAKQ